MVMNKDYAQTRFNVTPAPGRGVDTIVIHNTGTMASASNNCRYFGSGDRGASSDFFIDTDGEVYLFNGDFKNFYSWHAKQANSHSIGIECVSDGCEFTIEQKKALRELIAWLQGIFGSCEVIRHYDATGKICPAAYIDETKWQQLKAEICGSVEVTTPAPVEVPTGAFMVRVIINDLNYRDAPSMNSNVLGQTGIGNFTCVEVDGEWGKLKSGVWIYLANPNYVVILGDVPVQQTPVHTKPVDEVALEVYQGKWGNNPERKQKLEEAGYDYEVIRKLVNAMF